MDREDGRISYISARRDRLDQYIDFLPMEHAGPPRLLGRGPVVEKSLCAAVRWPPDWFAGKGWGSEF